MAGATYRILERNTFTVTSAQLPANQAFTHPIAVNVNARWAVYGSLVLRVHSFSVGAGAGTSPGIKLYAYPSAPTEEDPNTLYRYGKAAITGSKITGSASFTPTMSLDSALTPGQLGSFLDILLEFSQWGTTAGNLTAVVSADLILKA